MATCATALRQNPPKQQESPHDSTQTQQNTPNLHRIARLQAQTTQEPERNPNLADAPNSPAWNRLKPEHRHFIVEYFRSWDRVEAYRKVYPRAKLSTARVNSCKLMHMATITDALAEMIDRIGLTPARIKGWLSEMALGQEPTKIVRTSKNRVLKEYDRMAAVKELARIQGMLVERHEVSVEHSVKIPWPERPREALAAAERMSFSGGTAALPAGARLEASGGSAGADGEGGG